MKDDVVSPEERVFPGSLRADSRILLTDPVFKANLVVRDFDVPAGPGCWSDRVTTESRLVQACVHLDKNIKAHVEIRQKMIAARYLAIADEETTVDFIIMGLQRDSTLALVIGNLPTSKPATIKELKSKFKVIHDV